MCFQPGDRVKQVRVEINPLRYLAIYGTVREYTDPDILVQWDDGTELRHDANAIFHLADDLERPEPIAYQNPDRSKWGERNINQWSSTPFDILEAKAPTRGIVD